MLLAARYGDRGWWLTHNPTREVITHDGPGITTYETRWADGWHAYTDVFKGIKRFEHVCGRSAPVIDGYCGLMAGHEAWDVPHVSVEATKWAAGAPVAREIHGHRRLTFEERRYLPQELLSERIEAERDEVGDGDCQLSP